MSLIFGISQNNLLKVKDVKKALSTVPAYTIHSVYSTMMTQMRMMPILLTNLCLLTLPFRELENDCLHLLF